MASKKRKRACATGKQSGDSRAAKKNDKKLVQTPMTEHSPISAGAPTTESAGQKQTETHDHADEHGSGDVRVHCGKEYDAGEGDERGEGEHVLEAAKQVAERSIIN
ncbi:hypothetical protein KCV07_g6756, partial [Aureobasidium melanogenum]